MASFPPPYKGHHNNSSPVLGEVAKGRRGLWGSAAVWGSWEVRLDLMALRVVKGIKGSREVVLGLLGLLG